MTEVDWGPLADMIFKDAGKGPKYEPEGVKKQIRKTDSGIPVYAYYPHENSPKVREPVLIDSHKSRKRRSRAGS